MLETGPEMHALKAVVNAWAAGLFLVTGWRVGMRRTAEDRRALGLYSLWWVALSAFAVAEAALAALDASDARAAALVVGLRFAQVYSLCLALCGVATFTAYVLTGRSPRFLVAITAFYACYYGLALLAFLTLDPSGAEPGALMPQARYELDFSGARAPFMVVLLFPHVVAALAYVVIVAHVRSRTHRYRIALVCAGMMGWSSAIVLEPWTPGSAAEPLRLLLALMGALLASLAYSPPRWMARRFGIERLPGGPTLHSR